MSLAHVGRSPRILSFPLLLPPQYQPMLLPDYVWPVEAPEVTVLHFEVTREDQI